jgi:hypothetical protein
MMTLVQREELLNAFEWVSSGETSGVDAEAYISKTDGRIYYVGEGVDDDGPADLDDDEQYFSVPTSADLDLGRSLMFRFADAHLPDHTEEVRGFFRNRGAYGKAKDLLARAGQLDAWHKYEREEVLRSLEEWCEETGIELIG